MTMPGFNAEVSLGGWKEDYALTPGIAAGAGKILPQFYCRSDEGGTTCFQCWDEGGISGCYSFRLRQFTAF
ncbi:MAG TPA: hypothetical protein VG028_15900 [Terriglobia bacterium]|nr:hypothetical protein [Terriglobia bacterium]